MATKRKSALGWVAVGRTVEVSDAYGDWQKVPQKRDPALALAT